MPIESASNPGRGGFHLDYLDGIRGIAAFYVTAFHGYNLQYLLSEPSRGVRDLIFTSLRWLCLGHYAVDIFIVLSGYVLMLPLASRSAWSLPRGWGDYLIRRARRILPPLYAAVALTALLTPVAMSIHVGESPYRWLQIPPAPSGTLRAHLLMINNFGPHYAMNTPLWSVATECQIYLLFPLLLLPGARRLGALTVIPLATFLGLALYWIWGDVLHAACPWYIGLFAMGMAAAYVAHSGDVSARRLRISVPWGMIAGTILGAFLLLGIALAGWYSKHVEIVDPIIGIGFACLLVQLSRQASGEINASRLGILRVARSRGAIVLGSFSYSLYLTHYPILKLIQLLLFRLGLPLGLVDTGMFIIGIPMAVAFAWAFASVFERLFASRSARPAAADASNVPAEVVLKTRAETV